VCLLVPPTLPIAVAFGTLEGVGVPPPASITPTELNIKLLAASNGA